MGRKMTRKAMSTGIGALPLIERAVHLLRRNNFDALAEYYLGTLPFILALLYFWSDMSRNPMAAWYCGPSAAGVALLFIWMKIWQVRFCRRLWCRLQKVEPEKWSWKRTLVTVARQTALHATGVVILPLAAIVAVPLGWVYAFYQNLCVVDDTRHKDMMRLAKEAQEQAVLWPGQNHLMLTLMTLFGLFVFLNLGVGLILLPYLLKSLLGIETVFTLSGMRLLNTTFFAVLCGLTYLCIDPIIKAIYVLRCFYGRSLQTGDDLKSALRPFLITGFAALMLFMIFIPNGSANEEVMSLNAPWESLLEGRDYADRLDGHIESVLEQRRFAWRLPREEVPETKEDQGWIRGTLHWTGEKIKALFKIVGHWIEDFIEWLVKKIPVPKFSQSTDAGDYREIIRWVFYALGFGLALWLVFHLVRWLKRRRPVQTGIIEKSERLAPIDLADESITAEDLPLDRWLAMAREMTERQDFRKALRALYLSVLALLADRQRVRIAPYKSNRDYADELARRAHAEPELLKIFDWCIGVFERSWYGTHPVGKGMLDQFMDHQERLAALVQPNA